MKMNIRNKIVFFLILLFITFSFFGVYWNLSVNIESGDYNAHNRVAQWVADGSYKVINPGYHLCVGYLAILFQIPTKVSAVFVLMIAADLSIYVTYMLLKEIGGKRFQSTFDCRCLMEAFVINIIQPIFFESIRPGYSSGNGYISPTQALCKPFILLSVLAFFRMYSNNEYSVKKQAKLLLCLAITCLVKPIFEMAFIPSMGILLLVDLKGDYNHYLSYVKMLKQYLLRIASLFFCGLYYYCNFITIL